MHGLKQFPLSQTRIIILEQVLENSIEIKRVGRIGPGRSCTGRVLKRVVNWSGDGFTWQVDRKLTEKLLNMLNLREGKGALIPGDRDSKKDDRDIDCEPEYSDAKLVQAAAGLLSTVQTLLTASRQRYRDHAHRSLLALLCGQPQRFG